MDSQRGAAARRWAALCLCASRAPVKRTPTATVHWREALVWLGIAALAGAVLCGCAGPRSTAKPHRPAGSATNVLAAESLPEPPGFAQRVDTHAHYAAGVLHDAQGDSDAAMEQFLLAAQGDPANELLVIELSQRLLRDRQFSRAADLLARSAARPEASGQVYGWLGLARAAEGKTNLAVAAFQTAIQKAPESLLGHHGLAQLYLQQQRQAEALKVFDAAAARESASASFLVEQAEFLAAAVRANSLDEAEGKPRALALLERAARLNPQQPAVLQRMAGAYKSVGELARAAEMYRGLLDRHGGENPAVKAVLQEQLLRLYLAGGDTARAESQIKEILEDNPTAPKAHLLLGAIAAGDKRFAEAASCYRKALLLDADLEPAYYDLAGMQLTLGQPEEALATLAKARGKFPATFVLEFYTGVALAAQKKYLEALKSYTSAELLAKASEPARLNHVFYFQVGSACERIASAAWAEGRDAEAERPFAEAERNMRRAIELSSDNAEALNYLGYMWAERGMNLDEAHQLIERALKLEPESSAILDSMAWVLFQQKRPTEALDFMLKAVRAAEKPDPTLFDHLGDIYAALGRMTEAREAWGKALKEDPANAAVQRKLEGAPADR